VKEYNFEQVNLVAVTKSVLRTMEYQLKQNDMEQLVRLPESEIIVMADADSITEALTNLLDNAIKYSQKKKSIDVSVLREQDYAVMQVSDQGIGITEEDQLHIFNAFYRSEDRKIKTMGGAGLGLAQVWQIAEAHHGKITVKSKVGVGSTFSLFLPLGEVK